MGALATGRPAVGPPQTVQLGATVARWCRLLWVLGLLAALALAVVATPALHAIYQATCPEPVCDLMPQPNATTAALLARLGVAAGDYATLMVAFEWVSFALWAAIGAVILWKRPGDPVGLLLATIGLFAGPSAFLRAFALAHPAITLPAMLQGVIGGSAGVALLLGLFPDGRWVPRWARWVALAAVVEGVFANVIAREWAADLDFVWTLALWAVLLGMQVYRYRRVSTEVQRQQAKWVLFGVGLFVVNLAVVVISVAVGIADRLQPLFLLTCYGASSAVALAFAFAILRYRLFDIDVIINRALVYGALTAGVGGAYVLLVGGLGALLQARGDGQAGGLPLQLIAAGVVAVLFQPLRERVQRGVDRLLYGRRAEPYAVVARLGGRLEAAFAPEAILPTITATVAEALRLPYVAIALDAGDGAPVAAATGAPAGPVARLPLHYQGAAVGQLLVCPRRGEADLGPTDRRLLADLAQQAGVAVHGVRLMDELREVNADLRRSRERLVLAREEERRRIRRDLHDDLAPTLAGLALGADAVADLVPTRPERAQALARELHGQIREAVGGIRRLVHDLRPPTLDEYGLLAAIRERAAMLGAGGAPAIAVEAPADLPPLPAAVEVAAYRIAQEALMNAVKHARARRCRVALALGEALEGAALELVVEDDGVGLPAAPTPGVGLRSMRERAEELGGTLAVEAAAGGGTRVRARLPIRREATP